MTLRRSIFRRRWLWLLFTSSGSDTNGSIGAALAQQQLPPPSSSPDCSFLAIVVDESGSMAGEQEFLRTTAMQPLIESLELDLDQLVIACSYGYPTPTSYGVRNVGCSVGFNENDYDFNTNGGGIEDGFRAIYEADQHAKNLTEVDGFRLSTCDKITYFMILVTDEDRDDTDSNIKFQSTLQLLEDGEWNFHGILNQDLIPMEAVGAFNETADDINSWTVYVPTNNTLSTSRYDEILVTTDPIGVGFGTTAMDYVPLAFLRNGAVWNLNTLRSGGSPAATFTQAFVEITRDLIEEVVTASLKPCAMIQLLMDESYSMEMAQDMIRSSMETILASTLSKSNPDYRIFVCTFGFGATSDTVLQGCSLGYDEKDYAFEQIGSKEDGWNAIRVANDYFTTLSEIDGMPFDQCDFEQKMMILVTDEDRDIINTGLSFPSVSNILIQNNWTFTALLNQFLNPLEAVGAVKRNNTYTVFHPTNRGSYSNTTVTTAPLGSAFGSTYEDYTRLVQVAGAGSVWNINTLRTGGPEAATTVWNINTIRKTGTEATALISAFEDTIVKQLIYNKTS